MTPPTASASARVRAPTAHNPIRPLWLCRRCGHPWPCGEARLTLLQRYSEDQLGLTLFLTGAYREALGDLTRLNPDDGPTPADLFTRFLTWAPRPATAAVASAVSVEGVDR